MLPILFLVHQLQLPAMMYSTLLQDGGDLACGLLQGWTSKKLLPCYCYTTPYACAFCVCPVLPSIASYGNSYKKLNVTCERPHLRYYADDQNTLTIYHHSWSQASPSLRRNSFFRNIIKMMIMPKKICHAAASGTSKLYEIPVVRKFVIHNFSYYKNGLTT